MPSAGAVWWRATIRARAEAARAAGQPITLLQGIAAATAVGLFVALAGAWWRSVAPGGIWFERFDELVSRSASVPVPCSVAPARPRRLPHRRANRGVPRDGGL